MERCDVVAHAGLVDVDVWMPHQLVHNLMMRMVSKVRKVRKVRKKISKEL